jgi:hypothetical protein
VYFNLYYLLFGVFTCLQFNLIISLCDAVKDILVLFIYNGPVECVLTCITYCLVSLLACSLI